MKLGFLRSPFVTLVILILVIATSGPEIVQAVDTIIDGNIVFTGPGQDAARDIHTSDNLGGMRFFNAGTLTTSPDGAAIQLFGNGSTGFPGQAFIDSGANTNAAVIFRTAPTSGAITERMRIDAQGKVGIGAAPGSDLVTVGGMVHSSSGGFRFPNGTVQTTAAGGPYANIKVVAGSGSDFTSIQAALNSITDNGAGNRYLIFVAPGTYSEQVTMKEYVDIQGAGEGVTIITAGGTGAGDVTGTVTGANNAELRFLTVENTGGNINSVAIRNNGVAPTINHVTARTSTGLLQSVAVYNDGGAAPTLTQVTATASNPGNSAYGMQNVPGAPTIVDSAIRGLNGTSNYGISAGFSGTSITTNIFNSRIEGSTNTIRSAAGITTRVAVSQLAGGPVDASFGPITCAGVYDESFAFFASACP